ncbi:MAG: hypothetical protein LBB13_03005, partial [Rickettsiales bacterium]|nr:hypothetical protein [Rickettsiales bacterium]
EEEKKRKEEEERRKIEEEKKRKEEEEEKSKNITEYKHKNQNRYPRTKLRLIEMYPGHSSEDKEKYIRKYRTEKQQKGIIENNNESIFNGPW